MSPVLLDEATSVLPWAKEPSSQGITVVLTAADAAGFVLPTASSYPITRQALFFVMSSGTVGDYGRGHARVHNSHRMAAELTNKGAPESTASLVARLRSESGLTWEQLARIFNVSRRAVHLWASGGNMNSHNQEIALDLFRKVQSIDADSAESRRQQILMPQPDGTSLYDEWKSTERTTSALVNPATALEAGLGV